MIGYTSELWVPEYVWLRRFGLDADEGSFFRVGLIV